MGHMSSCLTQIIGGYIFFLLVEQEPLFVFLFLIFHIFFSASWNGIFLSSNHFQRQEDGRGKTKALYLVRYSLLAFFLTLIKK